MTTSVNPSLETAESLFKELVWDSIVKAATQACFVAIPMLGAWPLRSIVTWIIGQFSNQMFKAAKLTLDLQAIGFINAAHKRAFDSAMVTLKIIAHDKGVESDDFKKAKENAKAALSEFTRYSK